DAFLDQFFLRRFGKLERLQVDLSLKELAELLQQNVVDGVANARLVVTDEVAAPSESLAELDERPHLFDVRHTMRETLYRLHRAANAARRNEPREVDILRPVSADPHRLVFNGHRTS